MRSELVNWLLAPDNPSVRYFALRDLLDRPAEAQEVISARSTIMRSAPVRAILDSQYPAGCWIKPDRGYSPKYKATVWQLIFLVDLGATRTQSIARACEHVMTTALRADCGLFSAHKHSTGLFPCLNGDLLRALWHFGYRDHPVVRRVLESLAQCILVDGFLCVRNGTQPRTKSTWLPCTWGCVKVLRGFAAIPTEQRSLAVHQAVEQGVAYLLSRDLTRDQHPALVETRSHWLHFGFPLGYGSDLLEALLTLVELDVGLASLRNAETLFRVILEKRDETGRWPLEHALRNTWADFGSEGKPNKWVTLRATKVIGALA